MVNKQVFDLPVFLEKEAHKIKQIGDFAKNTTGCILRSLRKQAFSLSAAGACLELYKIMTPQTWTASTQETTPISKHFQHPTMNGVLGKTLEEPIYQDADRWRNLFGFRYKMGDYEKPSTSNKVHSAWISTVTYVGMMTESAFARLMN